MQIVCISNAAELDLVYGESCLTDRTKVSHKKSLLPIFDNFGHELVYHEDSRNASEKQDEEAKREETTDRDAGDIWLLESFPWHDCTDVHEATEVQNNIYTAVDFVMALLGFLEELPVPVQGISGDETCEQIVGSEHSAYSNGEELFNGQHHSYCSGYPATELVLTPSAVGQRRRLSLSTHFL